MRPATERSVRPAFNVRTVSGGLGADPTVPANWLAQKVCVDGTGSVVSVDPYTSANAFGAGCPSGLAMRNLRESDPVPYYNYYDPTSTGNPTRFRYTNAYETHGASGQTIYVMDRQFQPSNVPSNWYVKQSFYPGSTHWDTYEINNGWVSNTTTRDNNGLEQTFWGNLSGTPTPYNGWIDFPTSYFAGIASAPPAQNTYVPVHNVYWEQSGLSWPTPTQSVSATSTSTQTTWKLLPGYRFDSGKTMNTLVSYHQSQPYPADTNPDHGHIEAWFFTVPYGPIRWEVWSAASCLASGCSSYIQSNCSTHTATMTFPYKGANYTYYRTNCADWERGTALAASGSTVPTLPVPKANLLADFHFADDPLFTSQTATNWRVGSALFLSQQQSTASGDTQSGRFPGVRYVKLSCNVVCTSASTVSQDVAVSSGGIYSFGLEAETESSSGSVAVSLAQIDANGQVLGAPHTIVQAVNGLGDGSNCGNHPRVENCALYVGDRTPVYLQSGAVRLRVTVQPLTAGITYDVTNVYLGQV